MVTNVSVIFKRLPDIYQKLNFFKKRILVRNEIINMMINKINGVNRKPLRKGRSKSSLYWQKENLNKLKLLVLQVKLQRYLLTSGYLTCVHLTFHPHDL